MNLASMTPVAIFTLLNVAMALGLYVTALSGQLSMATAAIAGVGGYLAAVLTVNFGWAFLPAILMGAVGGALVVPCWRWSRSRCATSSSSSRRSPSARR